MQQAKHYSLLTIILVVFFSGLCHAQNYFIHTYSETDGLGNSTVNDALQDSAGNMWFATRSGISVYDGSKWQPFTVAEGLTKIAYLKITQDKKRNIWALPRDFQSEISCYDGRTWKTIPGISTDQIIEYITSYDVYESNDQTMHMVGTLRCGLYIFENNEWRNLSSKNELLSNKINSIVPWDDKVYIATDNGISIYKNGKIENGFCDSYSLPSKIVRGIGIEKNDLEGNSIKRLWLAGTDWLGYIEKDTFKLIASGLNITFDVSSSNLNMQPDYFGGLYFGNRSNLFYYNASLKNIELLDRENGLISEGATSLLIDREKNIWVTSMRGVSKIVSRRFSNYKKKHGLLEDEVTAIQVVDSGKIVFGHKNGLSFFNGNIFQTTQFDTRHDINDISSRVLDIAIDQEKNVWAAASNLGLIQVDRQGRLKEYHEKDGFTGRIRSVFVDAFNKIWISDNDGLKYFKDGKVHTINLKLHAPIRKIFKGPENSLILATFLSGIFKFDGKSIKSYTCDEEESGNNVYAACTSSDNTIWIGSLGGLFRLENDKIVRVYLGSDIIRRPVFLILEDNKHRLWFGTDNGVIVWDGQEKNEYNIHNGFVGKEINRSAGAVDESGNVWIGADLGVSCYNPDFDNYSEKMAPPILRLSGVDVDGKIIDITKSLTLAYDKNNLIFHFKGISFIDEKNITFRLKLEGFDQDWIFQGGNLTNQIRYTSLPPGTYRFHAQAQNVLGTWSDVQSSAFITIKKPYWATWWFYVICSGILGLVIWGFQSFYAEKKYALSLQKQVEKRTALLEESAKSYQQMFEDNYAAMVLVDPDTGKVIDANKAACRFYGKTRQKVKNIVFKEFNVKINKKYELDRSKLFDEISPGYYVLKQELAGGVIRDVEIFSSLIQMNERIFFHLVLIDITERKRIENELAAEKDRLAVTLHSIGDGVISTDISGQIVLMNKVAEELTGWKNEAIGKPVSEVFHVIDERTRLQHNNPVNDIINQDGKIGFVNHRILIARDGTERIITDTGAPIRDNSREIIGVVIVFRDITQQKKIEDELIKASKLESIGILAGGIAHDFNNILMSIMGYISMVRRDDNLAKTSLDRLKQSEEACRTAKNLTKQLLTFSKGGLPVKKIVSISELIKDSAEFALKGSNVKCEYEIDENLWSVEIDEGQIGQVINNLIINANQAMPNGGIIYVKARNVTIIDENSFPSKKGKYVRLSIRDQGIGISEKYIKNIFDPYFTTKQKGSGLGLTTSYSIIKKHEGCIHVESIENNGAEFIILLPAVDSGVVLNRFENNRIFHGTGNILILDDDEKVAKVNQEMIQYLGYNVTTVKNGENTIAQFQHAKSNKIPYDLVLLDLTIPGGIGGIEVIKELLKIDRAVKAIAISGYSNNPIMSTYKELGFRGFITKPYSLQEISEVIYLSLNNNARHVI